MRTHTNTHRGKGKTKFSVAGEGVTKRAESGPFGTFCHHVVTKRAGVTKHAGSNKTCFVTLVTKCAGVTKRAYSDKTCFVTLVTLVTKHAVVTKRAATGCMCLAGACV